MEGSTSSMMLARESVLDFSPLIFTYSSFKFLNDFLFIRFERLILLVPFSLPFCFDSLSSGVVSVPHVESFVSLFFCLDLLVSFCPYLFYFLVLQFLGILWSFHCFYLNVLHFFPHYISLWFCYYHPSVTMVFPL